MCWLAVGLKPAGLKEFATITKALKVQMAIDFRNTNTLWASILVETLKQLGLTIAVICPGSRSAPLAVAFAQADELEAIPVLDERSASFFALGLARQRQQPVALICTSGTAGANFYPAIIEAKESRVPLLIFTADRPPELRHCNAGQTIDQQKLYGQFPNWYTEVAMPSPTLAMLAYLRQTLRQAWECSLWPEPGPVHLNLPFREPLAPVPDRHQAELQALEAQFQPQLFFASLKPWTVSVVHALSVSQPSLIEQVQAWQQCPYGVIVAGIAQPRDPGVYCEAIAHLSTLLGWPVLAEGLSPVRNYAHLNPNLITTYDTILRHSPLAQALTPKMVIRIGEMPTSKKLRTWLEKSQPQQWVIEPGNRNLDPIHGLTTHLLISVEQIQQAKLPITPLGISSYLLQWRSIEAQVRQLLDQTLASLDTLFEGKAAWVLSRTLPSATPIFIASSTPVRDVEFFWTPNPLKVQPFFNRGANGIDGTLSTALGIAYGQQSSVMLTGDLALLHDTNGFLLKKHWSGHLTILLINNNGGGIFEMLPIAQFDPPFETFFATPQAINFAKLCTTYEVEHEYIQSWEHLQQRLNPLPTNGIRVLELKTDRRADAHWRRTHLQNLAAQIPLDSITIHQNHSEDP
jgi:2-succinyl-5-enolpyruvyl-6-hydroxy-3-cyclohexene-1-carboxylate synthase